MPKRGQYLLAQVSGLNSLKAFEYLEGPISVSWQETWWWGTSRSCLFAPPTDSWWRWRCPPACSWFPSKKTRSKDRATWLPGTWPDSRKKKGLFTSIENQVGPGIPAKAANSSRIRKCRLPALFLTFTYLNLKLVLIFSSYFQWRCVRTKNIKNDVGSRKFWPIVVTQFTIFFNWSERTKTFSSPKLLFKKESNSSELLKVKLFYIWIYIGWHVPLPKLYSCQKAFIRISWLCWISH